RNHSPSDLPRLLLLLTLVLLLWAGFEWARWLTVAYCVVELVFWLRDMDRIGLMIIHFPWQLALAAASATLGIGLAAPWVGAYLAVRHRRLGGDRDSLSIIDPRAKIILGCVASFALALWLPVVKQHPEAASMFAGVPGFVFFQFGVASFFNFNRDPWDA